MIVFHAGGPLHVAGGPLFASSLPRISRDFSLADTLIGKLSNKRTPVERDIVCFEDEEGKRGHTVLEKEVRGGKDLYSLEQNMT